MTQSKLPRDEFGEQQTFVHYLQLMQNKGFVVKYTAIPNNTWTPSDAQKNKNKELGLRAGFPDLIIVLHCSVVCVEMKVSPNKLTPEQALWGQALNEAGVQTVCCYGFEAAKQFIDGAIAEDQKEMNRDIDIPQY